MLVLATLAACQGDQSRAEFVPGDSSEVERQAIARLQQRAVTGDPDAEVEAIVLEYLLPGQSEEAVVRLEALAEQGNGRAAGTLANLYLHGRAVAQNDSLATLWLDRAVELGDSASIAYRGQR